jgi:hypothetical protein
MTRKLTSWRHFVCVRHVATLAVIITSALSSRAQLTATIDLPDVEMQVGTSLTFDITITATGEPSKVITGLDFYLQTADGGPEAAAFGGTTKAPAVTAVDIVSGTIFALDHDTPLGGPIFPQVNNASVFTTLSGTVPNTEALSGSSKVATVTLDATGVPPGLYTMTVKNVLGGAATTVYFTQGPDFVPTLIDGTINVTAVPEPNATAAVGGLLLVGAVVWRCKRASGTAIA